MGEGERAYRVYVAGEPGALELNDERRDEERSTAGGGNIVVEGVLGTDGVGVRSALCCEDDGWLSSRRGSLALTDSMSLAVDSRRNKLGRLRLWL